MNCCFPFSFKGYKKNTRSGVVLFCSGKIDSNQILGALKKYIEEHLVPSSVYFVISYRYIEELSSMLRDYSFKSEFESLIGEGEGKYEAIYIDDKGGFVDLKNSVAIKPEIRDGILQSGMLEIFKTRKGLIASSGSYHFVKPSGNHCNGFVRASNLLVSGIEVAFLAQSLLPYLNAKIKRIYIDTSSIAYLIATALRFSGELHDKDIMVDSFESYSAFKHSYDFVVDEGTLVVISASTSGRLAIDLMEKFRLGKGQVVTLFGYDTPNEQQVICDIKPAVPNEITSIPAGKCEQCDNGSRPIHISGDQFLPDTPKHELLLIRKTDFSKQRESFFGEFATRQVLGWRPTVDDNTNDGDHLIIDVNVAIGAQQEEVESDLKRAVNRYISRNTNAIVHLEDDASAALAVKLKGSYGDIKLIAFSNLETDQVNELNSVLVVAGAITSGRKLLSVARKLRALNDSAAIVYFVGFSKLPNAEAKEQLRKDLTHGGHELFFLRSCPLPRVKKHTKTAWDFELDFLDNYSQEDPFSDSAVPLPKLLSDRLTGLRQPTDLHDGLFLSRPDGDVLELRQTFAFWSDLHLKTQNASQADVYWTILAILHDLRLKSNGSGLSSLYHSTLISPVCFDRFNDGVIQACLLRAATPMEMNYALDESFSRQMTDIILSVVENWQNDQGEAALEFLMALACNRLRLSEQHINEIASRKDDLMPDVMQFLFDRLCSDGRLVSR